MKKIKCTLATLDKAIDYLDKYEKSLDKKNRKFLESLANDGADLALGNFMSAQYDGDFDVATNIEFDGNSKVYVNVIGDKVAFIEFGTGAMYPDIHPNADEEWMQHGSWSLGSHGMGHWADTSGWFYAVSDGVYNHTYGNPANMCIYYATRGLEREVVNKAKEAFG